MRDDGLARDGRPVEREHPDLRQVERRPRRRPHRRQDLGYRFAGARPLPAAQLPLRPDREHELAGGNQVTAASAAAIDAQAQPFLHRAFFASASVRAMQAFVLVQRG
jgi:hypothetical protein